MAAALPPGARHTDLAPRRPLPPEEGVSSADRGRAWRRGSRAGRGRHRGGGTKRGCAGLVRGYGAVERGRGGWAKEQQRAEGAARRAPRTSLPPPGPCVACSRRGAHTIAEPPSPCRPQSGRREGLRLAPQPKTLDQGTRASQGAERQAVTRARAPAGAVKPPPPARPAPSSGARAAGGRLGGAGRGARPPGHADRRGRDPQAPRSARQHPLPPAPALRARPAWRPPPLAARGPRAAGLHGARRRVAGGRGVSARATREVGARARAPLVAHA